ncbi:MAG: AraC family transcriptional regulator [Victivallales bacterium]|jgi:AraC-like DNA-binding protein|nr:AraC family transcriptional regulator [Victivallales bacterium]
MHIQLEDLKRQLGATLPLSAIVANDGSTEGYSGKRGNVIEFVIRFSSSDSYACDLQNGERVKLPFPHIYIKYPQSDYYSGLFAPRKSFAMLYNGSLLERFAEYGISTNAAGWPIDISDEIRALIEKINQLCEHTVSPGYADRIDSYVICLLRELSLQNPSSAHEQKSDTFYTEKLQKIASYLRRNYAERINFDKLVHEYGISRRTFYRYWQEEFSCTPGEYLMDLRMHEACRLLRSNISITEIAFMLSFSDTSYFSEQFKRRFGCTPGKYRKH